MVLTGVQLVLGAMQGEGMGMRWMPAPMLSLSLSQQPPHQMPEPPLSIW